MFPDVFDYETESDAEYLVYRRLQEDLPDTFTVLHSIPFRYLDSKRRTRDAEIDFLIIHADRGLLLLEVKGGKISFDRGNQGGKERWVSLSKSGKAHELKRSPIEQVSQAMYNLRTLLGQSPLTAPYTYPTEWAVAFPDVITSGTQWGVDVLPRQVIGAQDMGSLHEAILRAYGPPHKGEAIGAKGRKALLDLIKPRDEVSQLGLMSEIASNALVIRKLTEDQRSLLDVMHSWKRAVFRGCAGSGKTTLALEKSRALASEGLDVLLTCYNRALADWLRRNVEQWPGAVAKHVYVAHYHDLAVRLCAEAGQQIDVSGRKDEPGFWDETVPALLNQATPAITRRFDAIVADEGQDFDGTWWITLNDLLHVPDEGIFYIFLDEQQDLYGREHDLPFAMPPLTLNENLRNTREINALTTGFYRGNPKPVGKGPEGREPEIIEVAGDTILATLGRVLHRLTHTEGIATDRIVVLTPRSRAVSLLKEGQQAGACALSWSEAAGPNQVRVSTINGYKGLESDVVVLAEPEFIAGRQRWRELCYVALSRARHHVIVLGTLPTDT